jgi:glycosyltransferase involved in cell wall biosynthesis
LKLGQSSASALVTTGTAAASPIDAVSTGRMNGAKNERTNLTVCALVPYPANTTPSQRFRIEQWLPYLEEQGISVDLKPFISASMMQKLHQPGGLTAKAAGMIQAFARRTLEIANIGKYDVILVHRAACLAGPAALERLITVFRKPIIFDFDDAIYLPNTSHANRFFGWMKFPGKTATLCRLSAHVVAGSNHLAEFARKHNSRVTVVPTSIDTDLYQPAPRNSNSDRIVIGWTGSSTSQTHLEMFADVLRELAARRAIEIRVQSNREPNLAGVPFVWIPWSPETEVEELTRFDIGIKPMPDDPWSRGKCPMKEIQYMSMGIPTVCSAVGASREIIRHGENGFLASTRKEWLDCLTRLIDDPNLREVIGAAGRRTVEEQYSMRECAGLFAEVVRETVESFQSSHSAPSLVV